MLPLLALLSTVATAAPPARNVYVGCYLTDVSDFDLKAGRFKADLRVWVKWLGDGPAPELTFENAEVDAKTDLGRDDDAQWHSVQWRVQGTFRGDFPLQAFPFDTQTLPVVLGLDRAQGLLQPDLGASGMSPRFSITGWSYEPYFSARTEERAFGSDLGSVANEGKSAIERRAVFQVEMKRPFGPYLIKFALPLLLILLMAMLGLFLPADRLDVRSALGITALLACIAFHYTQADTLPDVTYLVAADMLFLGSYVFVAGTLVVGVIAFRLQSRDLARAVRADRLALWLLPLTTLVALTFAIRSTLPDAPRKTAAPTESRPSLPLLRVSLASLDTPGAGTPSVRAQLTVRRADGERAAVLVDEVPALTNSLVRLLPDGGMRVRWQLKPNLTWSDGSALTAADLAFSIATMPEPQRVSVVRVDERTVDVTYATRRAAWLDGFGVFPAARASQWPDAGRDALNRGTSEGKLAGAGGYELEAFEADQRLTLKRNPRFAGPVPVFERIEVTKRDPMDAARALVNGELDVLPSLSPDSYEFLKGQGGVRVLEQPGELLWVLVPNLEAPPWNSLPLRQALLGALDRDAMVKELAPSPARVAWGWKASAKPATPKTVAASLQGLSVKVHVSPLTAGGTNALLLERVKADLAKVGVTIEVEETKDLYQLVQRHEFDGLALVSRDTGDPGRFMNAPWVGGRVALEQASGDHYDDEMVERYEAWVSSLYAERKGFLEHAMQEAWFERLPMIPLVLTSRLAAVRADLVGPEWGQADSLWWNLNDWRLLAEKK
ncbi:MAG: ABC transporter substrate-binding protein [Myxococcaceae bacterium]